MKLSAVIIAKNEEKKIRDCLDSVKWADEILVIDTGSSDETVEIAKKNGARVIEYKGTGFADWRNKGLREVSGEWILYVDADERVTPELRSEIESGIRNNELGTNAYAIPRKNIVFGKEMKHGGFSPDYVKRLFRKHFLKKWTGDLHEEPNYESNGKVVIGSAGNVGHLKNELLHIKHDNLSEMVDKTNEWSEFEAKLMFEAHHPPMNIGRFFTAGLREFWLRFVIQMAFLDGTEGVIYGMYQVYSRLISYAKLWELQLHDTNIRIRANDTNGYKY